MNAKATGLIPMAHVVDVQRSADFYRLLGLEVRGSLHDSAGGLRWVHLVCDHAHLMLARASGPIVASEQAVLFYLYSPDLVRLREQLLASAVEVSAITYPDYMPKGEIRLEDPDGYVLLAGHTD
jgi:Glyoxalase/Bleomycin resistance protein/Dioxygenase superfamily